MILNSLDRATRKEKMARLTAALEEQFTESARLEEEIRDDLRVLGYGN